MHPHYILAGCVPLLCLSVMYSCCQQMTHLSAMAAFLCTKNNKPSHLPIKLQEEGSTTQKFSLFVLLGEWLGTRLLFGGHSVIHSTKETSVLCIGPVLWFYCASRLTATSIATTHLEHCNHNDHHNSAMTTLCCCGHYGLMISSFLATFQGS